MYFPFEQGCVIYIAIFTSLIDMESIQQELQQVSAGITVGSHVVNLAWTSSLWKKGCPVCRSPGILLSENTADWEKGTVSFWNGDTASPVLLLPMNYVSACLWDSWDRFSVKRVSGWHFFFCSQNLNVKKGRVLKKLESVGFLFYYFVVIYIFFLI